MSIFSVSEVGDVLSKETLSHNIEHSLSTQLTNGLLTPNRYLWVIFDFFAVFWFFIIGVWLSPHETFGEWTDSDLASTLVFSTCFCILTLGMGYYERSKRFTKSNIFLVSFSATILSLLSSLAI